MIIKSDADTYMILVNRQDRATLEALEQNIAGLDIRTRHGLIR
ncbi:MAG: hypothetical protein ACOX6U_00235 [Oscillospiraceae bacterium]